METNPGYTQSPTAGDVSRLHEKLDALQSLTQPLVAWFDDHEGPGNVDLGAALTALDNAIDEVRGELEFWADTL